ncbi:MAG: phosphotyrosine protein phosphatase [Deltaproteobacteria bacterium]|nr:phosphotyrosine protein phosphatase [Deltaproteobacteria bacterium]
MTKQKVLFLCNQNRLRSPTAEAVFRESPMLEVKSAGVDKDASVPVNLELLEWADIIFVMEKGQRNVIHKKFKDIYKNKRIACLYIPDDFEYMDPDLIQLLKKRLPQYVD